MTQTCECGCGQRVRLASLRFVKGHNGRRPASERFWEKVDKQGDCWEWQGATYKTGYGAFRAGTQAAYAHRFAYEHEVGPIPEDMFVCHHCDNRKCVRPDHLFVGTHSDNMDDMREKGREKRSVADDQIREIRSLCDGGWVKSDIAAAYGMTPTNVGFIGDRQTWRQVA